MHIITGLLITKLLTGNLKENKFKGFKGVVEIIHQISGRVRFLIPSLKNEPEKCKQIKIHLEKAKQIKLVTPNPLTGRLLIEFSAEDIDVETITGVVVKILGLEKAIEKAPKSFVSKELGNIYTSVNSGVYEYTNGMMDLKSLVTTSFLTMGVYSLIRNRSIMPSGISLLYWAFKSIQQE